MPQNALARGLLFFGFGLAILLMGVAAWLYTQPQETGIARVTTVGSSGSAQVGGPFTLIDQTGASRSDQDFAGQYLLIYFGYTHCPDFCPTSLTVMTQALDRLADSDPALAAQVTPLFISVDPERDTVEAMAVYAPFFHERLVALTGSAEAVKAAAAAYKVYYAKVESEDASDYLMDHATYIFLMDKDGGYVTHFVHNTAPETIAETVKARAAATN